MEQESGQADSEDEEFFDPSDSSPGARTGSSPGRALSRRMSSAETSFHDADEAMPGEQPVRGYLYGLGNVHSMRLPSVCEETTLVESKCQYRLIAAGEPSP